jgi:ABC-type polysaccharide/polyol phosphate export permease
MIRDLVRYRELIRNLVLKDLTLKYRGSVLGVAWSLAHPALLLAVYTLAFRHVMKIPVPHYPYFLLVPLLLLHVLFTTGLALLLAALTTAWRDIAHLTEVGLVLVFWLTPIVYPVEMVPGFWRSALALSPPAAFAAAYQDVLFWGRVPAWTTAASTLASTVAALALGLVVFKTMSPTFVERV